MTHKHGRGEKSQPGNTWLDRRYNRYNPNYRGRQMNRRGLGGRYRGNNQVDNFRGNYHGSRNTSGRQDVRETDPYERERQIFPEKM